MDPTIGCSTSDFLILSSTRTQLIHTVDMNVYINKFKQDEQTVNISNDNIRDSNGTTTTTVSNLSLLLLYFVDQ